MEKQLKFTKMHGCGNDYIYINCLHQEIKNPDELSRIVSDRHFGIGSDGLVLILPSESADFRMRMFNADGSEAQMCGNASRCVGKYVYDKRLTDKRELSLETNAGIKILSLHVEHGLVNSVTVDMGAPNLIPAEIPVYSDAEGVVNESVTIDGCCYQITCVSMGNPHAVIYVDDVDSFDVHSVGRMVENHPMFPERTNTEFVQVISPDHLKMRVWERGSGETLACGTGACASLVASVLNGVLGRKATLQLVGGDLQIEWDELTGHVLMTGPAVTVFEGEYRLL